MQAAFTLAACVSIARDDEDLTAGERSEVAESYAQRALDLLRRAAERGFADAEALRADRDFDPIRGRPEFAEILRRIEAAGGERR